MKTNTTANFLLFQLVVACWYLTSTAAFSLFDDGTRQQLKAELLKLSSETKRGMIATSEQQTKIKETFERLEKLNPTKQPLRSSKVNGVWSLEYTTSEAIRGKQGSLFPKVGPILQEIDTVSLRAENSEVVNCLGVLPVPNKVTAALIPVNNRLTNVQFKRFSVGPFGFDAPEKFKGYLDVTYLDDDLRLTRGDKGNLFVLTRTNV